jgi:hypothetical protein
MRDVGPVHFTDLKRMALSPAHFLASVEEPRAATPPMRFGSLVHHVYAGERVVVFDGERRGNKWKDFAAANDGAEIFTAAERERALRCADSLSRTPHAVDKLVGEVERTIAWTYAGRSCSSRLDVLGADFVTDLKTTSCAEPYRFGRAATGRFAYHAQLAFYLHAARSLGRDPRAAYIVAVETAPPFAVTVLRLTLGALLEGEKLCRLWMEQLRGCEENDCWPAYCQSVVDLDADSDTTLIIDGEELAA